MEMLVDIKNLLEEVIGMSIRPLNQDFSIFEKFCFEREPVAIKYEYMKPEGFDQLDKKLALCEMIKEAQQREKPFYITVDNESCAGKGALGMVPGPSWAEAGLIGEKMGYFRDARENMRCTTHYEVFKPGVVNYVVYAKLSQLTFDPDLLIFVGTADQAEILLRAMAYSTGDMYESKATPVFQCSWLYTYPHLMGKINYITTGLGIGMKARKVFPSGLVIVSIPANWIPVIVKNLNEMELVLPYFAMDRETWVQEEADAMTAIDQAARDAGLISDDNKLF